LSIYQILQGRNSQLRIRSLECYNKYYFVFYNPTKEPTSFIAKFRMLRVEYDVSNPIQKCNHRECWFSYHSKLFLIVSAADSENPDDILEIHWMCLPFPIYLSLFVSVILCCCLLPFWIYLFFWIVGAWHYAYKKCKYRVHLREAQQNYNRTLENFQKSEKDYEILKPAYERARSQWYASQFSIEKERILKEYTEKCIKYDQDKAIWMRTVYVTEKERLMQEYELALKKWNDLYGSGTLTAPLLQTLDIRSLSTPIAINDNV